MDRLEIEYPFVDEEGFERFAFVKYYAFDENKVRKMIKRKETGEVFVEIIEQYPSPYTYEPVDKTYEECEAEFKNKQNNN